MKTKNQKRIKDHKCKTCGIEMTEKYFKKYNGNCSRCDMKVNPQNWGRIGIFTI